MTPDKNALVGALQEGPFEQPLWSSFLAMLQTRMQCAYAGIFFRPIDDPTRSSIHLYSAEGASPALQALMTLGIRADDPLTYFHMEQNRAYRLEELYDHANPDHRRFRQEYIIPGGFIQSCVMRVAEPSGVNAWLSIARPEGEFTKQDMALLAFLAPHFGRALRSHIALERERFRAQIAGDAMQRLDFGWLSLDASGHVVETSAHAEELLLQRVGISRQTDGTLRLKQHSLNRDLQAILSEFAANASAPPRALRVNHEPWLEMLLVPAQQRPIVTAQRPIAVAYLHGDNRSAKDRQQQIIDLFGLLPSEARLALALGRGLSIAEAAEDLGLTITTARSYSKQVYAKMGARGQADVIRFLLTSVLALA